MSAGPHACPPRQTLRVGCKINLFLRITGVREDGYHLLDSLFWPLDAPYDTLHCEAVAGHGIEARCSAVGIDPANNTLTRAHAAYAAHTGFAPGLRVRLEKGVPHGAGLGGGSADAAAVLRWCNARAPQPLDRDALAAVAARVGADVPFFLHEGPCRVQGIGEAIRPYAPEALRGLHLVLLCPDIHISTPWAYGAWDSWHKKNFSREDLTSKALKAKEIDSCPVRLCNDLEGPVFAAYPALRAFKEALLQHGATLAVMSGSGASLVGLYRTASCAHRAADALRQQGVRVHESVL